jgi:membrane fusion protein, multidrug efflux system
MPVPRPSSSVLLATGIALAATIWMLTGVGTSGDADAGRTDVGRHDATDRPRGDARPAATGSDDTRRAMRVTVRKSEARTLTREITVSARTEANRTVELRAETEGRVIALGAERGRLVRSGDAVASLDLRERPARLEEAQAQVAYMELQHEAAQRLRGQQLAADVQIAESYARLQAARATLQHIEQDMARSRVTAPFDAIMQERHVELGDFVSIGDPIALLVDTDPLIIVGEVSEREVAMLESGGRGSATAVDGTALEGTVRYIAPVADEATRTFRIELAAPNPAGAVRAGLSAELRLQADEIEAHFISSALLALSDAGAVGVKAVDDSNTVRFYPVDIVSSASDGIWVSGLPDSVQIISVGQGFVSPGETVEPVMETSASGAQPR